MKHFEFAASKTEDRHLLVHLIVRIGIAIIIVTQQDNRTLSTSIDSRAFLQASASLRAMASARQCAINGLPPVNRAR